MPIVKIFAGGKAQNLSLVQSAVIKILDSLNACGWHRKAGIASKLA